MTLARVGAGCDIRHVCVNLMAAGAATPAYGHILYHRARPVRDVASGASQIRYVSILIDTQRPATHARSATFPHDRFVHPEREHLSSLRLRPRAEARRPTAARPRQHSAASKPQADHDRAQRRGRRERAWPTTPAPTSHPSLPPTSHQPPPPTPTHHYSYRHVADLASAPPPRGGWPLAVVHSPSTAHHAMHTMPCTRGSRILESSRQGARCACGSSVACANTAVLQSHVDAPRGAPAEPLPRTSLSTITIHTHTYLSVGRRRRRPPAPPAAAF